MAQDDAAHDSAATPAPPPEPVGPPRVAPPGRSWVGALALSTLLPLLAGGAGAWLYESFGKTSERVRDRTGASEAAAKPGEVPHVVRTDDNLRERVDQALQRLEGLEHKVGEVLKKAGDLPTLGSQVADLPSIRNRLDQMAPLPDQVRTLGEQVRHLDDQVVNYGLSLQQIQNLNDPTRNLNDPAARRVASRPTGPQPAAVAGPAAGESHWLAPVADLFEQKKYGDALKSLKAGMDTHADDARTWYYAALATGFSTGDWKGEARRLVEKGIEREKAGTPSAAEIDATFSDLTTASGKDWLATFRQRAH